MRFGLREAVFILLLLAMPTASFLFVLSPKRQQMEQLRRETAAKQSKLHQLEAATRVIDDLGSEIEKLTQAIAVFEQKLPAEREMEVVLKEIWELAARNNLQPKRVQTDKPVATASYHEQPIRMTIAGDFDGFYSFMLALEKMPRITRMPKMKLIKANNTEGQVAAELVLSIFFDSEPKARATKG